MKLNIRILFYCGILISGSLPDLSCRRDNLVLPPVIQAEVTPKSGNTTDVFTFDLAGSESRSYKGPKVFTRWDWDGDGTWDTPFTRLQVFEHRYYVPGTWNTRLEMTNLDGAGDTLTFVIPVARGYSSPKPVLKVSAPKGHIFTIFRFDASGTRDDEDSLDQLDFRWDFEGDGHWDTSFSDSAVTNHQYQQPGFYNPMVQARDPSGRTGSGHIAVQVGMEDPKLLASFRTIPDSVTNNTPVTLDASESIDLDNPDKPLLYRWDWNNDRAFDTEWLEDPRFVHSFREEQFFYIRLEIKSYRGLTNDTVRKVRVYHNNIPPRPNFTISTIGGNTGTNFRFDAWISRDTEDSPSDLALRWDYNGDGIWDTDYSKEKVFTHTFNSEGTYTVILEATDRGGLTCRFSRQVFVGPGNYETGILQDKRGVSWEYYGTVKIGDQWWLSKNICVQDTQKYHQYFYGTSWSNYYVYGNLYSRMTYKVTCPPGWRVPSKADWDTLFARFSAETLFDDLMPGGKSGFNMIFGGKGQGVSGYGMLYSGIDLYGCYWSATTPGDAAARSTWIIEFDRANRQVLQGWRDTQGPVYSVRCVKE